MTKVDAPVNVPVNIGSLKCLQCITESAAAEAGKGDGVEERYAVTLAPMWLTKAFGPQMIVTAVAVPTCREHLSVKDKTPQEMAIEGGILLGGAPG